MICFDTIDLVYILMCFFFFKQKTAYEMRISDWSSDVCSSDLDRHRNLDPRLVEIEFLDDAVEARERAFEHLDLIADLVIDADLGLGARRRLFLAVEDARGLGLADRLRLARRPQEARALRRIIDEGIKIVVTP